MRSACGVLCKRILEVKANQEVFGTVYVRLSSIDYPAILCPHRKSCDHYG